MLYIAAPSQSPSAFRLYYPRSAPDAVRPLESAAYLYISHETLGYIENVPVFFLRPEKVFQKFIERKLCLSLTFRIHCSPFCAQVFYHVFFIVVSLMINFVETWGYISGYFRVCDGEDTQGLHIFFFLVVALIITCQIWRFAHTELADNGSGFILFFTKLSAWTVFFKWLVCRFF